MDRISIENSFDNMTNKYIISDKIILLVIHLFLLKVQIINIIFLCVCVLNKLNRMIFKWKYTCKYPVYKVEKHSTPINTLLKFYLVLVNKLAGVDNIIVNIF